MSALQPPENDINNWRFSLKNHALIVALTLATLALSCRNDETAVTATASAEITDSANNATPTAANHGQRAIELAIGSPESATKLATEHPEEVATAVADEMEKLVSLAKGSPESTRVKAEALAKLTDAAAAASSTDAVRTAVSRARSAGQQIATATGTSAQ
jgi:hypothetical protein